MLHLFTLKNFKIILLTLIDSFLLLTITDKLIIIFKKFSSKTKTDILKTKTQKDQKRKDQNRKDQKRQRPKKTKTKGADTEPSHACITPQHFPHHLSYLWQALVAGAAMLLLLQCIIVVLLFVNFQSFTRANCVADHKSLYP